MCEHLEGIPRSILCEPYDVLIRPQEIPTSARTNGVMSVLFINQGHCYCLADVRSGCMVSRDFDITCAQLSNTSRPQPGRKYPIDGDGSTERRRARDPEDPEGRR